MMNPPVHRGPLLAFLGGSSFEGRSTVFLRALARSLVEESHFRIATTDFAGAANAGGPPSAAFVVAHALLDVMPGKDVPRRILTYLDSSLDRGSRFSAGTPIHSIGRTKWSQRLYLISQADVVCLIGGERGTQELYHLAQAIEKPVLPLPFSGGAAKAAWDNNKKLIGADFDLAERTVQSWSKVRLESVSDARLHRLAKEVVAAFAAGVRRRCFVMMPFEEKFDQVYDHLIQPALQSAHCVAIRTDREAITGDITEYLRGEIHACHCGLAVATGCNPNVLYELGLAHALGKPVLLLQDAADSSTPLPFDIRNHRTLNYPADLEPMLLDECLGEIHSTLRGIARRRASETSV